MYNTLDDANVINQIQTMKPISSLEPRETNPVELTMTPYTKRHIM